MKKQTKQPAVGPRLEPTVRRIHCCACTQEVDARLTDGGEIYPHRPDLHSLPFWRCNTCLNFVGCHHKTKNRTEPLGCIPTAELKEARKKLHALIDPIWQSGKMGRRELYEAISREVGWNYHTAKTRTMDEARAAYRAARKYA
jgi:zinc-finger-containing domain